VGLLLLALTTACTVTSDPVDPADTLDAHVEATDALADVPDAVPDGRGKDAVVADADATDAVDTADVPPSPTWILTTEGAEPATDAWVRVKPVATDPQGGTVTVAVEASAFADLLGLSFHLGVDPARAEVVSVTKLFTPPETGSTTWGLLARSTPGSVQGGLGLMRRADQLFGGGSQFTGALAAPTALVQVRLQVKAAGTFDVSLGFPDTVAVSPDWTALPLERVGLTVTAAKEGDHE